MKSRVYFIRVADAEDIVSINSKLKKLLARSGVMDVVQERNMVAVKIHFGEEGNTGYVRPAHARVICEEVIRRTATGFLADANTLYRGRRLNAEDHIALAYEHGFTREAVGMDIFVPDDNKSSDMTEIEIDQRHIKKAKLARIFTDCDTLVVISHFKGHALCGFGGAIKNIGMGCASREGKLAQHCDVAPAFYVDRCKGCGECVSVCPTGAISLEEDRALINRSLCIGCASCLAACANMAIFVDFEAGDKLQEKMAEYAFAVLREKQGRSCFINFALRINKECDCWRSHNPPIAPDVGIFASMDPVAIDKACLDLVNDICGEDVFKKAHPNEDGTIQLSYSAAIGLGNMDYELISL